ncbi:hypothetical protein HMPREF1574_01401 [Gardnerella pickettii JCP7659]|nr:hypothetical protein HMPREF1574_01401 [Gardnerella pickettii JCP7659]
MPFRLKRSAKRQIGAQAIIAGIIRVQEKHRPNKTQALGET